MQCFKLEVETILNFKYICRRPCRLVRGVVRGVVSSAVNILYYRSLIYSLSEAANIQTWHRIWTCTIITGYNLGMCLLATILL